MSLGELLDPLAADMTLSMLELRLVLVKLIPVLLASTLLLDVGVCGCVGVGAWWSTDDEEVVE